MYRLLNKLLNNIMDIFDNVFAAKTIIFCESTKLYLKVCTILSS